MPMDSETRAALPGAVLIACAIAGCEKPESPPAQPTEQTQVERLVRYTEAREPCRDYSSERHALFGDLHVHTAYSFDAAANSLDTYPADANRFARGEAIPFFPLNEAGEPVGTVRLDRPLDFVAVTDHGEFLGERALCRSPGSPSYDTGFCTEYRQSERQGMLLLGTIANREVPERFAEICGPDGELCREFAKDPWREMIAAAEDAYDRSADCRFTSLVGYEYTGTPGLSNIHRNVIFRNANVPLLPVSYVEAPRDHLLWEQLDAVCGDGCDYLTIPHNSNLSNGRMFAPLARDDHYHGEIGTEAQRSYALDRLAREPVMEIFQHKGNSECINGLSTVFGEPDEFCNFEQVRELGRESRVIEIGIVDGKLAQQARDVVSEECSDGTGGGGGGMIGGGCIAETDFLRSNLLKGMRDEQSLGVNTAKLGVIGSTDTHASTPGAVSESDWGGHVSKEATPEERLQPGLLTSGILGNPGGLAGVWAVENSRDAIFEALERREVFGTSGPRIQPRFFAGWDFDEGLCDAPDRIARAYANGVPMGGDLDEMPAGARPMFLADVSADSGPGAAGLQQIQLIKGWIDDDGKARYRIDILAGGSAGSAGPDAGHARLCAVHTDENFAADQPAYYYLRAIEVPTPRWSRFDCDALGDADRPPVCAPDSDTPAIIQEMAWSSPIWFAP